MEHFDLKELANHIKITAKPGWKECYDDITISIYYDDVLLKEQVYKHV